MDHAVYYRDASGEVQFEGAPSLDAALELVERLRNDDGASDVRVFREVPIEVRTYYKVVAITTPAETLPEPPPGAMPLVPPVTVHAEAAVEDVLSDEPPARRALFSRT